jgi:TRAP-type C4-dicarboxylate transport system permease small subunit
VLIGLVFLNVATAVARATGTVVIGVDEVLVFGMIWMVMLGMLLVTAERGHINFELVTSRVGPRMQVILMVVTHLILSASCAYAAWQSFLYVSQITRLGQTSMALGMPMLIPHSAVVVGFGGTAIIAAILAIGGIRQLVSGEGLEEQVAS